MFAMIKRLGRPFMAIGRKMGEIFNLGRKTQAQGVLREQVLNNTSFTYQNIPKFHQGGGSTGLPKGSYLRPYDNMTTGGAFVGERSSYIGN